MSQAVSLRLDRICDRDLRQILTWRNDPRIYKWCRQCEPLTEEAHAAWFTWQTKDPNTRMYLIHAIEGEVECAIGVCGLTSIDWINRRAEVSLYIDPKQHQSGIGYLSAQALMQKAFGTFNLNSLWGESFDGSPAIGLFEKCGFTHDGVRRSFYYREGRYVDAHLFSLLRSEYANRSDALTGHKRNAHSGGVTSTLGSAVRIAAVSFDEYK